MSSKPLESKIDDTGNHGIVVSGGSYNVIDSNDVYDAGGNFSSGFAHGIAVEYCGSPVLHFRERRAQVQRISLAS